ncbi:carboxymuconolactone decarboxylase family protein [Bailinhaonella thermotolerans]|uniref:Carboxymuconolactone decarboxylase family protein n=1 Tax=Bailinhaonella thermotolerans TaxID=1070861 RepID=A0A3A3ZZL8_9ACTN|nr:carboxymuconolactone decarboxylase family protein [Bailinhaonella thermotolerans]RJL20807.1 carboxymuconolactone decarboxylase family protein [Bailinhaonella thermotolerans]
MPRLRQVSRAEVTDDLVRFFYDRLFGEDRDPAAEPGTATGSPGTWWTVFALDPVIFRHCVKGFQLYRESKLDPVLRELGQTRAGWARGSQFVFSQHCKQMRALGVPEEKIAAIPSWQVSEHYDELERAVLAYTDALVLDGGRVADEVFDVLRRHLADERILELTYIVCLYEMHATMSRALRLEFDDRPEPVVEVPAPEGYGTRDIADEVAGEARR